MKVVVMGAGVIGVTTAWYLAKAGAEVKVVERQPGPAEETSYANAGELSFSMASPWASPGLPKKALKMLVTRNAPFRITAWQDPLLWRWITMLLRNCTTEHFDQNIRRMQRIARHSADAMSELILETDLSFDDNDLGTLMLCRNRQQLDEIKLFREKLLDEYVQAEILGREACVAAEPGLAAVSSEIIGGMRLPKDRTGDCRKFTRNLAKKAAALGVQFSFGRAISRIAVRNGSVCWVETGDDGRIEADRFVCALGSHSPRLLQPLGIRVPIYPVKGYSITLPVLDESKAPVSTVVDEAHKVAITRLGDRIRVGGTAELAGMNTRQARKSTNTQRFAVENLFPGAGDFSSVESWTGLRPMTPDGTPVLGGTRISNLFLNTGHGTFGWTLAAGSARAVTDQVLGNKPGIDFDGLTLKRYG